MNILELVLPTWVFLISAPIVFPLIYLFLIKRLKINIRSNISKQIGFQFLAVGVVVYCCIIALDLFKSNLIASGIGYSIAIPTFVGMFYWLALKLKEYRDALKLLSESINSSIQETTAGSEQISMSTQNIAQKVLDINISSKNIQTLLEILKSTSEQINLLSVNATIEAGRLGNEARGFGVVANELQKLHYETKTQLKKSEVEVKTILKEIEDFSLHINEITSATEEQTSSMEEIMELILKLSNKIER